MKSAYAAALLILAIVHFQTAEQGHSANVVLPNAKLLRCKSADCFQLWPDRTDAKTVFPYQMTIDMNESCLYGMRVLYDKSVPVNEVQAAIDERYGKWALKFNNDAVTPVKLWRVEPEKFAIQLSVATKRDEKMNIATAGARRVIYIAFGGRSACNIP